MLEILTQKQVDSLFTDLKSSYTCRSKKIIDKIDTLVKKKSSRIFIPNKVLRDELGSQKVCRRFLEGYSRDFLNGRLHLDYDACPYTNAHGVWLSVGSN